MEACPLCLRRMTDLIKEGKILQSYGRNQTEKDLSSAITSRNSCNVIKMLDDISLKGKMYEDRESIAQQVRNCVRPSAIPAIVKRLQKLKNEWEQQTFAKKS